MQQMRLQRRVVPPGTLCASSHGTGIFWFPATCTTTRDVERRRADSTRPRRRFQPPTACAEASSAGSKRPECGTAHARITVSEGARVVIDIVLYLNSAAPARRQGLAGRVRWPRVQLRRAPGLQSESLLEGGVRGVRAHGELRAARRRTVPCLQIHVSLAEEAGRRCRCWRNRKTAWMSCRQRQRPDSAIPAARVVAAGARGQGRRRRGLRAVRVHGRREGWRRRVMTRR